MASRVFSFVSFRCSKPPFIAVLKISSVRRQDRDYRRNRDRCTLLSPEASSPGDVLRQNLTRLSHHHRA